MRRKRKIWFVSIATILVLLVVLLMFCGPYRRQAGFSYRLIEHTVQIDATADSVFRFLGNSANARRWSVYVNHISPLNAAEVPDGQVGSRRRCFCREDETGTRWDEVITEVIPGKKRQISCYNMLGFPLTSQDLGTEQIYRTLPAGRCQLTFTFFFLNRQPGLWDEVKMRLASYRVKRVFAENMANIKRIVEHGS